MLEGRKSKQGVLRGTLIVVVAGVLAALAARYSISIDYDYLRSRILTGPAEGNYFDIATRLAHRASSAGGRLEVVVTDGSAENVQRLSVGQGCQADFAFVQDGTSLVGADVELIGRLPEQETVLLFARHGAGLDRLAQLKGKSIGVGPAGSGTTELFNQLFADPHLASLEINFRNFSYREQLDRLESGDLDIAAFVISEDAPILKKSLSNRGFDLIAPRGIEGLFSRFPWLETGEIKAGRFDPMQPVPSLNVPVARVNTLVLATRCAGRAERVALLTLLADEFPGFLAVNPPKAIGSVPAPALSPTARQFFLAGEPQVADRYLPWLVNLLSPVYWAYFAMALTVLFNGKRVASRYRLSRLDTGRQKAQRALEALVGEGLTHEQMREKRREGKLGTVDPAALAAVRADFIRIKEMCRAQASSSFTPMGDELYYRYQEHLCSEAITTITAISDRNNVRE